MSNILPNTLIIGAMKASTTLLYQLLDQHPDVFMPDVKEPHYFTSKAYGNPDAWRDYLHLFAGAGKARIVAEASTGYAKVPRLGPTPQRIASDLGCPKIVYILRDPVERTISNYRHNFGTGRYDDGMTLTEAIESDPIILAASRYAEQIHAYQAEFGPEAVHVMVAEQLHKDHFAELTDLADFLEIEPLEAWRGPLPTVNSAAQVAWSDTADRYISAPWRRRFGLYLPGMIKHWVKSKMARPATSPEPVTDEERRRVLELIGDDLLSLHESLGERIELWPSMQRLSQLQEEQG